RGAGGVLARPGPRGARPRRRGPRRHPGHPRREVPRLPLLVRLPGLPEPEGPAAAVRAARPVTDRGDPVGGVPAPPGAVHLGADRPPPGGEVLQGLTYLKG